MLSLSAESICLVEGKQNISQPVVPAEQGILHFNNLWCYLFYKLTGEEKDDKGIAAFASPGAACRQRRWQAQDFLIETCLSLHYCD
jgi:hypothetical protein